MDPSQIAQTALYQEVAERLRQRIFSHQLPPGARIDEQALTLDYGISRTPLREALKVLASEGVVRGAVQVPPDGRPVVLGPDHPVTGGYPVVAVVEQVDALAQAAPGVPVRFTLVGW